MNLGVATFSLYGFSHFQLQKLLDCKSLICNTVSQLRSATPIVRGLQFKPSYYH